MKKDQLKKHALRLWKIGVLKTKLLLIPKN